MHNICWTGTFFMFWLIFGENNCVCTYKRSEPLNYRVIKRTKVAAISIRRQAEKIVNNYRVIARRIRGENLLNIKSHQHMYAVFKFRIKIQNRVLLIGIYIIFIAAPINREYCLKQNAHLSHRLHSASGVPRRAPVLNWINAPCDGFCVCIYTQTHYIWF